MLQALGHLGQEHAADAAAVEQGQDLPQRARAQRIEVVAAQVGHLARRLVRGHALGQAAQVFDQHDAQGRGQRPHLAQLEFAGFLVGAQEAGQQPLVKGAVGMGHKSPGDAIDARQSRQRAVLQDRQRTEVAARHALVDFLELRLDHVEVVQQPLGGRAQVIAGGRLHADVPVRRPQGGHVALQAGKEIARAQTQSGGTMRLAQAAAVLGKSLRPEDLGPDRWLQRRRGAVEHGQQRGRGCGQQAPETGWDHGLQDQKDGAASTAKASIVVTKRAVAKPVMVCAAHCRG
ncbi:MAG: hypothetical protein IPH64_09800 [Comamonadaceae bacterium]|nr:hypothetical protein [Comamonadaceae bacterium]